MPDSILAPNSLLIRLRAEHREAKSLGITPRLLLNGELLRAVAACETGNSITAVELLGH